MNVLILLFGCAAMVCIGMLIGMALRPSPDALGKAERAELKQQRRLIGELTAMAADHASLGDPFGIIALNRINDYRNEIT